MPHIIPNIEPVADAACALAAAGQPWHWSNVVRLRKSRRFRGRLPVVPATPLLWTPGPLETRDGRRQLWPSLDSARHQHTTFRVGGDVVHIDWLDGSGGGPGFSLRTHMIFVNDVLSGAGWLFGCLGGNGCAYPSVTRAGRRCVVICDWRPAPTGAVSVLWRR